MKKFKKAMAVFLVAMTVTGGINQAKASSLREVENVEEDHVATVDVVATVVETVAKIMMDIVRTYLKLSGKS
jgi:uncharacterized membrane protein